jgi:hypothetical protein
MGHTFFFRKLPENVFLPTTAEDLPQYFLQGLYNSSSSYENRFNEKGKPSAILYNENPFSVETGIVASFGKTSRTEVRNTEK